MGTSLSGLTPATTFDALIKVGDNSALSASLKTISDGEGNDSPLKLSTAAVGIGSITNVETEINGKQATLVSGSSIKTINSTSVLGSGDISVQATLVSGTNIKTINSASLLGSGDVAVQETLVSGTNIKTINSTSLLGSGDISVSASAGGSNTQIQFNDSGAFGADSLFNWDNTNKRLGVGETTPTARVHIQGEGATSATTSLLVENSSGDSILSLSDDRNVLINNQISVQHRGFGQWLRVLTAGVTSNVSLYGYGVGNASHNWQTQSNYSGSNFRQFNTGFSFGAGALPPETANTLMTIRGSGATSSTTALLIENSSGTDSLSIKDDGQMLVGDIQSGEASAKLQIDSTTQGFLPPRMTTTQVEAIEEPVSALIIYNTSTNKLQCYDGSSWNNLF